MHKHFNKRLVTEEPSSISIETSSYVEDSSELQDDIDEHAAFRKKILRDPSFFKQLTLSFYSRKDTQIDPSPRVIQKPPETEALRTPTPKDNINAQIVGAKQSHRPFLSPPQKQGSPNFAFQQHGLDKRGRETPINIKSERAAYEQFNPNSRQTAISSNIVNKSANKQDGKQVTPRTFKISTVVGIDAKRALFQIPSPVLKRETVKSRSPVAKADHLVVPVLKRDSGKSKSPVAKTNHLVVPAYNGKLNSELSSGAVSVVPSTGATTPKYGESFVNNERNKLQQAKTLKMPTNQSQLKIKIPGQEDNSLRTVNTKYSIQQSVKNVKITSPVGFKNIETPVGSKTVMSKMTPSRPITSGMGAGHQFRAARILFQKENKASELEHQQEKLFEKYFERTEVIDSRISTIKKGKI